MGAGHGTSTKVAISNVPFQLHYKLTSIILVALSSVLVFYYIFGPDTITCMSSGYTSGQFLNGLCKESLSSTQRYDVKPVQNQWDDQNQETNQINQGFYPYVWLFLLYQAVIFCIPHAVWKAIDGGTMKQLASVLGNPNLQDRDVKLKQISSYVRNNFRTNDGYAFGFFMCETFNFVNSLIQIHMLNWFVRGQLQAYGGSSASSNVVNTSMSLEDLFPSQIKCTYHKIGASGTIQRHDAACILTMNSLHSKMYVFLVFWFIALAIISGLVLFYRLVWICSRQLRYTLLMKHYRRGSSQHLLVAKQGDFSIGDHFFMSLILENSHPTNMSDFLSLVHGRNDGIVKEEPTNARWGAVSELQQICT